MIAILSLFGAAIYGVVIGALLAVAAQLAPALDRGPVRFAVVALLTSLPMFAATFAYAFLRYARRCGGALEAGGDSCSRAGFVFQDHMAGLFFAALISLVAIPVALATYRRLRSRR